ncbi:MAG: ComEC/Rec2 family competence protein [Halobacteriota archaeon]
MESNDQSPFAVGNRPYKPEVAVKISSLCLIVAAVIIASVVGAGCTNDARMGNASVTDTAPSDHRLGSNESTQSPLLGSSTLMPVSLQQGPQQQLTLTSIDVGKSDALLLSWPDSYLSTHYMLVDGGTSKDWPLVKAFLESKNITYVDAIVCTHEHDDHLNGLIELLKGDIGVGRAYDAGFLLCKKNWPGYPEVQEYLQLLADKNIQRQIVRAGDEIDSGNPEIVIRVLNPDPDHLIVSPTGNKYDTANANCIVLEITYKDARFLLTGDALSSSYAQMMGEGYIEQADVLKVSHHGAISANQEYKDFLHTVQPKQAIVTCGCYRPDNETQWLCWMSSPDATRLLAPARVYTSACNGDIAISTDGKGGPDGVHYDVTTTKNVPLGTCLAECTLSCKA